MTPATSESARPTPSNRASGQTPHHAQPSAVGDGKKKKKSKKHTDEKRKPHEQGGLTPDWRSEKLARIADATDWWGAARSTHPADESGGGVGRW